MDSARACALLVPTALFWALSAGAQNMPSPPSVAPAAPVDAGATTDANDAEKEQPLPAEHVPRVRVSLTPKSGLMTGDAVKLIVHADVPEGDDVTLPEQSFAPFEIRKKAARIEPARDGRQGFIFELTLVAFDPGKLEVPALRLRVVTKQAFVGSTTTQAQPVEMKSLLANEPTAKLKPETKPVVVVQDDYTIPYVLGGIAAAGLIALLTWLVARYMQRRQKPAVPPPPPRPPWEIAVERLGELRRRKQRMLEEGLGGQFVDEVSDVVRQYLGGRFAFDGLESTSDEMLAQLRSRNVNPGLWQEVAAYLRRCDLVKFAKVVPDQDEADLVFSKAQDIVQFSMPLGDAYQATTGAGGTGTAGTAAVTDRASGPTPTPAPPVKTGPEGHEP
jgi:hypothetical protein